MRPLRSLLVTLVFLPGSLAAQSAPPQDVLEALKRWRDAACACATDACADAAYANHASWWRAYADSLRTIGGTPSQRTLQIEITSSPAETCSQRAFLTRPLPGVEVLNECHFDGERVSANVLLTAPAETPKLPARRSFVALACNVASKECTLRRLSLGGQSESAHRLVANDIDTAQAGAAHLAGVEGRRVRIAYGSSEYVVDMARGVVELVARDHAVVSVTRCWRH